MPDRLLTTIMCFGIIFVNSLIWYLLYILVAGPILCQAFQSPAYFYYWYLGCLPADPNSDDIYIILWLSITSAVNLFALILLEIAWDLTSIYSLARCIVLVVQYQYFKDN